MKLLLDTCSFLWATSDSSRLSETVRDAILQTDNDVIVSAASFWEISIKYGLKKLTLPEDPAIYLPKIRIASGFEMMKIGEDEVSQVHRLPAIHRDPFDRILICQANCHGMVIATNDSTIQRYPVRTIW